MNNYKLKYKGRGIIIYVNDEVIDIWEKHKQLTPERHESFGVLIGTCSCDMKEFWIESVTTPRQNDTSSRYGFYLKDKYHQEKVNTHFVNSMRQEIYLGTWHTHPEEHPNPSNVDITDWKKCIKRNKDRTMLFFIIGISEIRVYVHTGKVFESLTVI